MVKKIFNGAGKVHKFFVPFKVQEYVSEVNGKKSISISGTAINSCTTRNGHVFLPEELRTSAMSLCDKPILKDHNNSVDSIVGRTSMTCNFDEDTKAVKFGARIADPACIEKIQDGLITSVSVGAMIQKAEELEDGTYIMRGISFVELSLVAVPADPNAGLEQALAESFSLVETQVEPKQGETPMTEADIKSQMAEIVAAREKLELDAARLANEKLELQNAKIAAEVAQLKTPTPKPAEKPTLAGTTESVEPASTTKENKLPFNVVGETNFGKFGLEIDYTKYAGASRLMRY